MSYFFGASHIYVGTDEGVATIALADDPFEPSSSVMLQLAEAFDAQDVQLGMDKIYIELEDQIRSHYGGILAFKLSETLLAIELDRQAQQQLGIDGAIEVSLVRSDFSIDVLRKALSEMAVSQGVELALQ